MKGPRSTIAPLAALLSLVLASPICLAQEEEPEVIEPEPVAEEPPPAPAPAPLPPEPDDTAMPSEPIKDPKEAKTEEGQAFLEDTRLAPRGTKLTLALAIGEVRSAGFSIGGAGSLGWRLGRLLGLEFSVGGGSAKKRSGTRGFYVHGDAMLPIRFGICSRVPRVCPGLDLYIAVYPGVGYGYFSGNHAINGIVGVALESVRTRGRLDVGVSAAFSLYIDFLKDNRGEPGGDPWLSYYVMQLGIVLRWGRD